MAKYKGGFLISFNKLYQQFHFANPNLSKFGFTIYKG